MKWSAPADKEVVEAVLAAFCEPELRARQLLSVVPYRSWVRSYNWLDASGMALYFLAQVEAQGIEGVLPIETLARLRQNRAENRQRSAALFAEFVDLNRAFQEAGVSYCNLKGFTLSPDSCPAPELRCQLDLDFLIDGSQIDLCSEILAQSGYVLSGSTRTVREFRTGVHELTRIEDHYKARPQRSVELHFTCGNGAPYAPSRDARLDRLSSRSWDGESFPTLAGADQFVAQAKHLFGHVCSPSTRISWFLEYKRNIEAHAGDQAFWDDVRECSRDDRQTTIAIGLVTLLATRLFGGEIPARLNSWTLDRLPIGIRLWAETFGVKSLLADFPGTKRYLLLTGELNRSNDAWRKEKRARLLPLHRVPRIIQIDPNGGLIKRLRAEFYQLRYIIFRLRFHVVEGLRYAAESMLWKRRLAALDRRAPLSGSETSQVRETRIS